MIVLLLFLSSFCRGFPNALQLQWPTDVGLALVASRDRHVTTGWGPTGEKAYKRTRRLLLKTWLAIWGVDRAPQDTYAGGDCLFTAVATLVRVNANWLRAMTVAYARTHPAIMVPSEGGV